jgi:GMP synthase (glutamine-hydrolysing)
MENNVRTALIIIHVAFEDAGTLGEELANAGFEITAVDASTADLATIDAIAPDLVVVLGGPIGVYEHAAYPFIADEITLLQTRLSAKRPTLGICLGSQMIAAALGARVYPGTQGKEIGWAPLQAVPGTDEHPWFAPLLEMSVRVLHWHGDTFELPPGAVHLAQTWRYPHQAFSVGNHALALQFHPEVTARGLERWYVGHACELSHAGIDVRQLREQAQLHAPRLEAAARLFWRQWLRNVFDNRETDVA